ncbi:MAG: Rrf2 family transcriptional regulator [Chloroflexi bacterium]|nr:Rrf2 family transcriptional regulator [Chloroflexota bacterium]
MRVPMKVDYGVRALVDLALHQGDGPVPTATIARRQHMPEPYLDQVLAALHRYGFVHSRRGPQGGHMLARDPREINLAMVVETLEGMGALLGCFEYPGECTFSDACAQREVWQTVEAAVMQVLRTTSIGELVERQRRLVPVPVSR